MSIERAIRPFYIGAVTPPAKLKVAISQPAPVVVSIVAKGSASVYPFSYSFSSSTDDNGDKGKEYERTVDRVRVKNPDDDEQHVDLDVTKEVKLLKTDVPKSTPDAKKKLLRTYRPAIEGENIEILRTNIKQYNDGRPDTAGDPPPTPPADE